MKRRLILVPMLVLGLLSAGTAGAFASGANRPQSHGSDRAQGHFTTKHGAQVDFIANADLSGTLSYDDGTLSISCDGYATYVADTTPGGQPRVTVTSDTCSEAGGAHVTLKAAFVDRGQGAHSRPDRATMLFKDDSNQVVAFSRGPVRGSIQIK